MSKVMGMSKFAFFTMATYQIWSCYVTQDASFKNFLFRSNWVVSFCLAKEEQVIAI